MTLSHSRRLRGDKFNRNRSREMTGRTRKMMRNLMTKNLGYPKPERKRNLPKLPRTTMMTSKCNKTTVTSLWPSSHGKALSSSLL